MPMIRPSSDLRNKYNDIAEYVNMTNEPVFITKNGHGDTVLISNSLYDRLVGREEFHRVMDEALEEMEYENGRPAEEAFLELRERLGYSK